MNNYLAMQLKMQRRKSIDDQDYSEICRMRNGKQNLRLFVILVLNLGSVVEFIKPCMNVL